jgi:polar amino acid transport system substrate-binding protein
MSHALAPLFAPTGTLRASINIGNAVLARAEGDSAAGVSVDMANELAKCLGLPIELLVFKTAAESVAAVESSAADIGFFAVDPKRGEHIAFTSPYVLIEGAYLVRQDSPIEQNEDVDVAGHRVMVGQGSAYDLYLTRNLAHATIVRAASSQTVVADYLQSDVEVAAGVKQQLQADSQAHPGLRLLPGRFMQIRQAMGMAKARDAQAVLFLRQFVEDLKRAGFIGQALARHGIEGAGVAPAADPKIDPLA